MWRCVHIINSVDALRWVNSMCSSRWRAGNYAWGDRPGIGYCGPGCGEGTWDFECFDDYYDNPSEQRPLTAVCNKKSAGICSAAGASCPGSGCKQVAVSTYERVAPTTFIIRNQGGHAWGSVSLQAGTTYDVILPGRTPGPTRLQCATVRAPAVPCAGRVRMLLIAPDGETVVAVSTGVGAARGPGRTDGTPSTRNAPILGYEAAETGVYFIIVYDYHFEVERPGTVDLAVVIDTHRPVCCDDLRTSNCLATCTCEDTPGWTSVDGRVDCHYYISNNWCFSDGTAGLGWRGDGFELGTDGQTAAEACCGCGGGTSGSIGH